MAPSISILYVTALFLSAATSALSIPVATTTEICIPVGVLADGKTPNVICDEDITSLCNNPAWDSDIQDAIAPWCAQQNEELRKRGGSIPSKPPKPPTRKPGAKIQRGVEVEKRGGSIPSKPPGPPTRKPGARIPRGVEVEKRGGRIASKKSKKPQAPGPKITREVDVEKRGLRLASLKVPQEPKEPEASEPEASEPSTS